MMGESGMMNILIVQLVESALKRCEDVMEIYYGYEIFLSLIVRPMDNQYLPALLNLSHVSIDLCFCSHI